MFFQKKGADARAAVAPRPSASPSATLDAGAAHASSPVANAGETGVVLDALGGVISAIARFPVDLPHRSAEHTTKEFMAWQRHATLGLPLDDDGDAAASVGIGDRDYRGLVRAVAALRRDEQTSVEGLVGELRNALWTCVSAVHEAVKIDDSAEVTTASQLTLVKTVVSSTQMSTIKNEVLTAIGAIDRALKERREEQQRQYKTLASSLDSLGRQLEEARKESETDPLTRVGNRKHFDLMAQRAVQLFSLSRAPMTLLMIDLNKLKVINDSYGHPVGDAAIQSVASALWKVFLRQSDVICRYGGDEFAVILNGCELQVAHTLAKRLVEQVRSLPLPSPLMEFALGASVGVAQLAAGEDVTQWVDRADRAMYHAKRLATAGVMVSDTEGAVATPVPSGAGRRSA
jgi:diguanylate cyclase